MTGHDDAVASLVRQWVARADEDLAVARRLTCEGAVFAGATCFHAQQAAEKWLKAALTNQQIGFPKTHDLAALLDLLIAPHPDTAAQLANIIQLNAYGVEIRYPGETAPLTAQDAEQAVALAEKTRRAVAPLLEQSGTTSGKRRVSHMGDAKIGLIGLAVMGQNLVLNMEEHGFKVAVFNRTWERTAEFMNGTAKGKNIVAGKTMQEFVSLLAKPRQVMFMVKAGAPVDDMIAQVKPYLEKGDLLIDGGNSLFNDTERRWKQLEAEGFKYIGTGVSGGEEGARHGPAIMPGGSESSYAGVKPIFEAISAKVGPNNEPCVTYFGPGGAGHYVKMVHNGIEYGDMQLIAEAYDILQRTLGLKAPELHEIFADWNDGELKSYLIEITCDIFAKKDDQGGKKYLVDVILDEAQQKGTGKWTSQNALDLGIPIPTINAAVVSRMLSAIKAERVKASKILPGPKGKYKGPKAKMINAVRSALYASKICSYAQGMALIRAASNENKWGVNLGDCAKVWRGGCIIRSVFLEDIRKAFAKNAELPNLLLDPFFKKAVTQRLPEWRFVLQTAIGLGIPAPAIGDSLAYYDGYRSARLPANLTQAQRDYFGAHTYRRIDGRDGIYHTEWTK